MKDNFPYPLSKFCKNGAKLTAAALLLSGFANAQTVQSIFSNYTFSNPAGVNDVKVECWGAGGGGGGSSPNPSKGGGGGGGAYASSSISVIPGTDYVIIVGVGGTKGSNTGGDGGNGGTSSFGSDVIAEGGKGATGGNTTTPLGTFGMGGNIGNSQGDTKFSGGNGASAVTARSGGGGSSAGVAANGLNASSTSASGGAATTGGGAGAAGKTASGQGDNGGFPGGGASGAFKNSTSARMGGTGGAGLVKLTYTCPATTLPYSPPIQNASAKSIPSCTMVEDANGDGNTWQIGSDQVYIDQGFTGKVLIYNYSPALGTTANDWIYTQALNLLGNETYTLNFNYSNDGSTVMPENLSVFYGTMPQSASMTNSIANMPGIITAAGSGTNTVQSASYTFTPATTGVYYVGFKTTSTNTGDYLVLANIVVSGANVPLATGLGKLNGNIGKDGHSFLTWDTYNNIDAKGFTITRSEDGKHFYDAGFVANKLSDEANGGTISYNFYDPQAIHQKTFYRIVFKDEHQKDVYSNVIDLQPQWANSMNLTAFPNPAKDKLIVSTSAKTGNHAALYLMDINGKMMLQKQMDHSDMELDIHHLPSGIYLLKYQDDNGTSTIKVTKN